MTNDCIHTSTECGNNAENGEALSGDGSVSFEERVVVGMDFRALLYELTVAEELKEFSWAVPCQSSSASSAHSYSIPVVLKLRLSRRKQSQPNSSFRRSDYDWRMLCNSGVDVRDFWIRNGRFTMSLGQVSKETHVSSPFPTSCATCSHKPTSHINVPKSTLNWWQEPSLHPFGNHFDTVLNPEVHNTPQLIVAHGPHCDPALLACNIMDKLCKYFYNRISGVPVLVSAYDADLEALGRGLMNADNAGGRIGIVTLPSAPAFVCPSTTSAPSSALSSPKYRRRSPKSLAALISMGDCVAKPLGPASLQDTRTADDAERLCWDAYRTVPTMVPCESLGHCELAGKWRIPFKHMSLIKFTDSSNGINFDIPGSHSWSGKHNPPIVFVLPSTSGRRGKISRKYAFNPQIPLVVVFVIYDRELISLSSNRDDSIFCVLPKEMDEDDPSLVRDWVRRLVIAMCDETWPWVVFLDDTVVKLTACDDNGRMTDVAFDKFVEVLQECSNEVEGYRAPANMEILQGGMGEEVETSRDKEEDYNEYGEDLEDFNTEWSDGDGMEIKGAQKRSGRRPGLNDADSDTTRTDELSSLRGQFYAVVGCSYFCTTQTPEIVLGRTAAAPHGCIALNMQHNAVKSAYYSSGDGPWADDRFCQRVERLKGRVKVLTNLMCATLSHVSPTTLPTDDKDSHTSDCSQGMQGLENGQGHCSVSGTDFVCTSPAKLCAINDRSHLHEKADTLTVDDYPLRFVLVCMHHPSLEVHVQVPASSSLAERKRQCNAAMPKQLTLLAIDEEYLSGTPKGWRGSIEVEIMAMLRQTWLGPYTTPSVLTMESKSTSYCLFNPWLAPSIFFSGNYRVIEKKETDLCYSLGLLNPRKAPASMNEIPIPLFNLVLPKGAEASILCVVEDGDEDVADIFQEQDSDVDSPRAIGGVASVDQSIHRSVEVIRPDQLRAGVPRLWMQSKNPVLCFAGASSLEAVQDWFVTHFKQMPSLVLQLLVPLEYIRSTKLAFLARMNRPLISNATWACCAGSQFCQGWVLVTLRPVEGEGDVLDGPNGEHDHYCSKRSRCD